MVGPMRACYAQDLSMVAKMPARATAAVPMFVRTQMADGTLRALLAGETAVRGPRDWVCMLTSDTSGPGSTEPCDCTRND